MGTVSSQAVTILGARQTQETSSSSFARHKPGSSDMQAMHAMHHGNAPTNRNSKLRLSVA